MEWSETRFVAYLAPFAEFPELQQRVLQVLDLLPAEVQNDFLDDPRFHWVLENYVPGRGWSMCVPAPGPLGSATRTIVLRRHLATCPLEFAHYVIAHELAHAFLRNGPWGAIDDVEEAADALAAHWGFPRPPKSSWWRRSFP